MAIEPRPTRHGRILLVGTVARLKPTSTSLHDGRGQSLGFEGDATRLWSHFTMKFTRGKESVHARVALANGGALFSRCKFDSSALILALVRDTKVT
ncbi:hypothetical protein F444_04145 [Phytophthora nicotianae P1976]|uniref:Uncharacterized protein n=1 Tax=Phytophthora nicotianae P1976 TaxID=1317066 RepID=A0A081ARR5_PHYNI|nr:hypothetical protein F444_04145 [Phytophthora nicotianae P1976]